MTNPEHGSVSDFDTADEPAVEVARVVGRVSAVRPAERAAPGMGDGFAPVATAFESLIPPEVEAFVQRARGPVIAVLVVGLLVELVPGAPWILIVPALVGLAALRLDRRIRFGFADGFVGYRRDLGWPRGVQEDDDVHWDWRRQRGPSAG
jgi:hypothetical protein